jgi:membrane-bound lytic murein transglycosylase F
LRQRKYYSQTQTGYARGDHAVYYVENIRRYFDTLLWVDEKKQAEVKIQQQKQKLAEEYSEQLEAAANKPVAKDNKKPAKNSSKAVKSGPNQTN